MTTIKETKQARARSRRNFVRMIRERMEKELGKTNPLDAEMARFAADQYPIHYATALDSITGRIKSPSFATVSVMRAALGIPVPASTPIPRTRAESADAAREQREQAYLLEMYRKEVRLDEAALLLEGYRGGEL